jgi:hypothetical protein
VTTSFILTAREWDCALRGGGGEQSLIDKGLAEADGEGRVTLAPELRLAAEEAASAEPETLAPGVTALRGSRFCLLTEPYPHTPDTLRIALYKDAAALAAAIEERDKEW